MNLRNCYWTTAVALGILLVNSSAAWAKKDDVEVKVNQGSPAIIALTEGGSPLAPDTYSSSASIKLQYQLVAFNFPAGSTPFGTFSLGVRIVDQSAAPGADSDYAPALTLTLSQPGADAPQLQLSPSPSSFTNITGPVDPLGSSTVTITTNCTLAAPCPSDDGSEIVANLQFGGTSELGTSVKVQVRIKLVHPADCLQLYNFLTDQDLTTDVTSTEVGVVKSGRNAGKVTSTTPFGQFSDNVIAANVCGATSFDLAITLDPSFDTNPNDNPGNAVFTYVTGNAIDPEAFDIAAFGAGTPQGQTLCLANIQLDVDETFLATVHMGIRRGIMASDLSGSPFTFTAQIFQPNSSCGGGTQLDSATAEMTYTIK